MNYFKAVKKITVTEQIMEQIAHLITSGHLKPGEQLPNERYLAEQLQVTRSRVREALRALSLVGLITIKAGEGSFVNEQEVPLPAETITWMFHNEIHNLNEVYAARKLIESEVYLSVAEQITDEQHTVLKQLLHNIIQSKLKSPEEFLQRLDDFDLQMGEFTGNRIYSKLMQTIVHLRRETSLKLLRVPGAIEQSITMRSALLQSFKTRDRKLVEKSINTFFENSKTFYDSILE